MRVLFITRTYPPSVGGMQKFASDFYGNYQKKGHIDLLANSGNQWMIVFFFIKVIFFLFFRARKYDIIHIYDGVLSPLIPFIRLFTNAKVSFTVNGLDIVYSRFGYQKFMPFFLRKADRVIAISHSTMDQCLLRKIPKEKITVIPIGVSFDDIEKCTEKQKSSLLLQFNIPAKNKKILITVGRLVKRKGHTWFIQNVFNYLPDDYIYLIAGDGPEYHSISAIIADLGLKSRVFLLGRISDEERNCFYQIAHKFIMPNIHIENDQEGFGIVILEAGKYGLPVIASNIEGISDVIIEQKTGWLVEEKNSNDFLNAIKHKSIKGASISEFLISFYNWNHVIEKYYREFQETINSKGTGKEH